MAVSLSKGQSISLEKESGGGLEKVVMGLGWDVRKPGGILGFFRSGGDIDLDASCVLFDAGKEPVDTVWYRQLRSQDGSIVHTGDNRTGEGEGDDEQIIVDLIRVPEKVTTLVFTVSSFTGETFGQVENAFCRLVDARNKKELARYDLSVQGDHTAQIMCKVYREDGQWHMRAIGENTSGRTIQQMMPALVSHV